MIESLVNVLLAIGRWPLPWTVVEPWQCGVIVRLGTYRRDAPSGWHWHWPCGIEEVVADFACSTTALPAQPLTTHDGVSCGIGAVITWRVRNARKFLLETEDREGAMADAALGALARAVAAARWEEVRAPAFPDTVKEAVQKRARRYGIEVLDFAFSGCQKGRSLHVWGSLAGDGRATVGG